ncbi:TRAP transporter substrate-binding protein [Ferrovibrio sp.]|uniref:TRAP transporter substrate-binding protein n=1 Tax=Ferrovibrio sp. TaxID=1917215 RepID=UPI00311F104C
MNRREVLRLSGAGLVAGSMGVTLLSSRSAMAQSFRSADVHPPDYPTVQAVEEMGRLMKERSGGRLSLQVFHSRQLGDEKDTIEQTKIGALQFNRINMAPFNGIVPESAVPSLPFVFRSTQHMRSTMDGKIGDEILAAFEPHGFIGLCFYDSGARSFYNRERPILSPADMKGMKIRVIPSDIFVALVQALGANATPMPYGEVYTALKTGVIDGAENNWPSYESSRHFEVAKHYSLDQHSLSPEVLVMSKIAWSKLDAKDKEIVRASARDSVALMRRLWDEREKKSEEVVRAAGCQIVEKVDKKPFQDAMKPVYDRFVTSDKMKALVKRIQDAPDA